MGCDPPGRVPTRPASDTTPPWPSRSNPPGTGRELPHRAASARRREDSRVRADPLMRHMPDPFALDGTGGDVPRHCQAMPGYSISEISLATRRYSPRPISSIGFSSSNASTGRCSHGAIDSGLSTRPSRLTISDSSIRRSARTPVGSLRPASHPLTVLGLAPVAVAISRSDRPARSWTRRASSSSGLTARA